MQRTYRRQKTKKNMDTDLRRNMGNDLRDQLKDEFTRVAILLRGHSSFRNVVPGRLHGGTSRDIMAVSCSVFPRGLRPLGFSWLPCPVVVPPRPVLECVLVVSFSLMMDLPRLFRVLCSVFFLHIYTYMLS